MDCLEQAKRLYVIFIESASRSSFFTYVDALSLLGYGSSVSKYAISDGLKLVWLTCGHLSLPSLTSIIVNTTTEQLTASGDPFDTWSSDIQEVFNYVTWPDVKEIDWNYVWENRSALSDIHGTWMFREDRDLSLK